MWPPSELPELAETLLEQLSASPYHGSQGTSLPASNRTRLSRWSCAELRPDQRKPACS